MKIMAKEPYFPFYYRDFMVSTGEMTDAEVGKYLRYLIHQWEKGSIPGDPSMIQTIRFDSHLWETLESKFPLGDDGRRRNPRLEEIRLERDQYIAKRSAAGKVGAEARWDGKRIANANTTRDGKPHGKPIASTSTSTSTSTSIPSKKRDNTQKLEWFKLFWTKEIWGDLRGKSKTEEAWLKIDNLDEQLFGDICRGAVAYKTLRFNILQDGGTPKMAQGWLNDRRWEDELPEVEKDSAADDFYENLTEEEWEQRRQFNKDNR